VETLQDAVEGDTKDISVDGVFIFCSKEPEIGEKFPILLEPSEQQTMLEKRFGQVPFILTIE
jgi:hypothetical protein